MEDDEGGEHDVDLGAVGAAAAGEDVEDASADGSGTYQVYQPKLVKARDTRQPSSRLRRCAGSAAKPPPCALCFSWAGTSERPP